MILVAWLVVNSIGLLLSGIEIWQASIDWTLSRRYESDQSGITLIARRMFMTAFSRLLVSASFLAIGIFVAADHAHQATVLQIGLFTVAVWVVVDSVAEMTFRRALRRVPDDGRVRSEPTPDVGRSET